MINNIVVEPTAHYKTTTINQDPYIGVAGDILYWGPPTEKTDVAVYSQETVDALAAELRKWSNQSGYDKIPFVVRRATEEVTMNFDTISQECYDSHQHYMMQVTNNLIVRLENELEPNEKARELITLNDIYQQLVDDPDRHVSGDDARYNERIHYLTYLSVKAVDVYYAFTHRKLTEMMRPEPVFTKPLPAPTAFQRWCGKFLGGTKK